jgi:hypothetical protein
VGDKPICCIKEKRGDRVTITIRRLIEEPQ